MKRCPYCAEEIQDDAIKCKHCNEWLNRGIDKNSTIDHPEVIQESEIVRSKKDSIANTPKKNLEETVAPNSAECPLKPKKQMKMKIYGWGWIIFLVVYATGHKVSHFYSPAISLIDDLLVLPLLIVYFLFRNMFLKRMKFGQKKWFAGFKAGLFTCSIWFLLLFAMAIFDSSIMRSDLAAVSKKYSEEGKNLVEKEKKLIDALIQNPKSAEDFRHNAEKIDEYLTFAEQKRNFSREIFNAFKEIYGKSGKNEKSNLESIAQLQLLSDGQYETAKKALEAQKKYYSTGNESFFNEYVTLKKEADRLTDEYKKIKKDF